jgi:hypothetical protein
MQVTALSAPAADAQPRQIMIMKHSQLLFIVPVPFLLRRCFRFDRRRLRRRKHPAGPAIKTADI